VTETSGETQWYLRVTDLKQFVYCPRIVYYTYCLPLVRPVTFKMEAGVESHDKAAADEHRRSLRAYGLRSGERRFDVALTSERLGLSGRIDLVIVTEEGLAIPVDYKLSKHEPPEHYCLQLAAYAELIDENWHVKVQGGFIYRLPLRKAEAVAITVQRRAVVRKQCAQMRQMIVSQEMPDATSKRGRCVNCEFRRFCNDVF
jgi:CRISPR-associated exonuclease Cas4